VYIGRMAIERGHRLSMRISEVEWVMLQALADKRGITASDYVRMAVRDAYRAEFGDKRKPKRGP